MKKSKSKERYSTKRMALALFILIALIFMMMGPRAKATPLIEHGSALLKNQAVLLTFIKSVLTA